MAHRAGVTRSTVAAPETGAGVREQAGRRLSTATHIGYGLGAVGTGAYGTAPSLLLLFFMTDTLAIPASLAALGMFAVKTWDVAIDPFLGVISDRTRSRWGRRRPYLFTGAILLGISLSLLFSVPNLESVGARFAWVLVMFLICSTTFSLFAVPYVAMPAEMTDDYHERTTIMSFRMAFMSIGVLVAGGLAPLVRDLMGGGRFGYAVMSVTLGAICCAFMLTTFFATRHVPFTERVERPFSLSEQFSLAMSNRPFVVLWITFFVQMTAVGSLIGTLPYFVSYILVQPGSVFTLGFVVLTVASILAMPGWVRLSRRLGKSRGYAASLVLFAAMNLALLLLSSTSALTVFYGLVAVMGIGFAGTQLFPFAILPDAIQHDAERSGLRREGVLAGVWAASEGIGMAFGALVAGTILDWRGFIESTTGSASQPQSALLGIRMAFGLVPAALLLLSVVILRRGGLRDLASSVRAR
jgi:sugar (glycoside-pentoside-hexuronide) transporter